MRERVEIVKTDERFVIYRASELVLTYCDINININSLELNSSATMKDIATIILQFSGVGKEKAKEVSELFMGEFYKDDIPDEHNDIIVRSGFVKSWVNRNILDVQLKEMLPCGKFLVNCECEIMSVYDGSSIVKSSHLVTIDSPLTLDELVHDKLKIGEVNWYAITKFQEL